MQLHSKRERTLWHDLQARLHTVPEAQRARTEITYRVQQIRGQLANPRTTGPDGQPIGATEFVDWQHRARRSLRLWEVQLAAVEDWLATHGEGEQAPDDRAMVARLAGVLRQLEADGVELTDAERAALAVAERVAAS